MILAHANLLLVHAGLGLRESLIVEGSPPAGAFPLVAAEYEAPLWHDADDHAGVIRAIGDLQGDIERVTGRKPAIVTARPDARMPVIIGTVGKSALIDRLIKSGKLDATDLAGKWESFVITTINLPALGVDQALVIAGSDKRGTIYGIYELSAQLGVSPWYWWADVPVKKRTEAYVAPGRFASGEPVVRYRGIFINDEEPALGAWAREKFGGVNSKMHAPMFELLLRLRANYLWPAMWGKSFYEDDPESSRLADEYGIVIGTSHHEPMMRAHKDWTSRQAQIGNGEWNYATNAEGLKNFFREGIERNRRYETLITLGMRGDGDEPMAKNGDVAANISLLEKVIADQRAIITEVVNPDPTHVPQLWALYKEVADYYEHGMKVPDDVTLLWCDDNWGNIRRLPTPDERKRPGGAGVYYHFDYVGSPRSYKWINTNPLPKIWQQMNLAAEYGATRIWIVNVGDLKPMELPIEFFLRMAWDPASLTKEQIADWTHRWAEREFGPTHAVEIADLVSAYAKYNAWRKPELLDPTTFSFAHYSEAERVLAAWRDLVSRAEKIDAALPAAQQDAFFQLVLYPVKASATVAELHLMTGWNHLHARQGRASALDDASRVRQLFQQDQDLSNAYHHLAGGKWNHMMAQPRIGYVNWSDPKTNVMPELAEPVLPTQALLGVTIEGSESAWPGASHAPVLPAFDSLNRQRRWIDVFKRGTKSFTFFASADKPWVKLDIVSGDLDRDQRLWVEIYWDKIPVGSHVAFVTVSRAGGESVSVRVDALRSEQYARAPGRDFFGGLTGPVAIAAECAAINIPVGGVRWEAVPDYGRERSGMSIFPVTAASVLPPNDSPRLEYPVLIPDSGEVRVDLITGVSLATQPGRGVRIAVSFDDQPRQIIDAYAGQALADPAKRSDLSAPPIRDWAAWVRDNSIILRSVHRIAWPGVHRLKVWMVDPGIVVEKIVIHADDLPASCFGPPLD